MKIITLLRKPLDGNVAENTLKHGCGGINIEVCRVPTSDDLNGGGYRGVPHPERHSGLYTGLRGRLLGEYQQPTGRWPANFVLTHSDGCVLKEDVADWDCVEGCPVQELDKQSGVSKSTGGRIGNAQGVYCNQGRTGWATEHTKGESGFGDVGGASRYFMQFQQQRKD